MQTAIDKMFSLEGKVAVVTGGTRGIGEEIACIYAKAGAKVVICSRNQEAVDKAVGRIRESSGEVIGVPIDVALPEDRERLIRTTMDWGKRLDILVNNAGANPKFGGLEDLVESEFDRVINVNLKASLFLSQLVYKMWMKDNGGVIINVSSVGGFRSAPGINGYNVVKAALNHMTRCLASEWGHKGIRVNALAPGLIKTDFSKALWTNPVFKKMIELQPVPRIGEVNDLTGAALFLASDSSAFMTGHVMIIDGGHMVKS
ncbi:SDR family NAD(P)-dependent oxidoreductase [Thermodesulfobacteriota bacterium]